MSGARYAVTIDGTTRTHRDSKPIALEAANYLKLRNLKTEVAVRDIETGEVLLIEVGNQVARA